MSGSRRPTSRKRRLGGRESQQGGDKGKQPKYQATFGSVGRRIYGGIAALGVLVGAVVGGLQLLDAFEKRVKDDVPGRIAPRLNAVRERSRAVPLINYLRETGQSTRSFSTGQLEQSGYVFDVAVRIVGLVNKPYELRWSMYQRRHNVETLLVGRAYSQVVAAKFVPRSPDHLTEWPVWVPPPPRQGIYVVRFVLLDERGLPVARRDSPELRYPHLA